MCKVSACTNITDNNRQGVWQFMTLLGELISRGNTDGLGYAAFNKAGKLFGEKWLVNDMAFKDVSNVRGINASKMDKIYNFFGDKVLRNDAQAIILHTRAATCAKGIENTHPFVNDIDSPEVAIIHNGMIYNDTAFPRKYSTCDSEVLAHLYADNKVSKSLAKLNDFADKLQGWFTVLALARDDRGRMVMDAFSDSGRLGSYFIKELDTRIYSSYSDDVLHIAKALGLTAMDKEQMERDTAFRIDVLTGEVVEHVKLKTSNAVPVTYTGGSDFWDNWGPNIVHMEGNLSEQAFHDRWFGRGNK